MSTSRLLAARRLIAPDDLSLGWSPLTNLGFLAFLFVPVLLNTGWFGGDGQVRFHLGATLLSITVFLPLYAAQFRLGLPGRLLCLAGVLVVGLLLFPRNVFAHTYAIYVAALLAWVPVPLRWRMLMAGVALAVFATWIWMVMSPHSRVGAVWFATTAVLISIGIFFAEHFRGQRDRKHAELVRSREDVRRVAAYAERERIGRDLHDLLGHTLSMIALKSELAGKLIERDPQAARREIDQVTQSARQTLEQVRTAVAGIRSAVLASELASARLLLHLAEVDLRQDVDELPDLPPAIESALAMSVREAATNVQRHAHASRVDIRLHPSDGGLALRIRDNGRGGDMRAGTGLSGMRERIEQLGGRLQVDGSDGTTLDIWLPLEEPSA